MTELLAVLVVAVGVLLVSGLLRRRGRRIGGLGGRLRDDPRSARDVAVAQVPVQDAAGAAEPPPGRGLARLDRPRPASAATRATTTPTTTPTTTQATTTRAAPGRTTAPRPGQARPPSTAPGQAPAGRALAPTDPATSAHGDGARREDAGAHASGGRGQGPPGRPARSPAPGAGRAQLFAYGGQVRGGVRIPGPYVVLALRTTGFAPGRDRVVEVAALGVDARGRAEPEPFVTLVGPPGAEAGADAGPTFLHGLTGADVRFAPSFAQVARMLLAHLEGRVVVAHNAGLAEQFLAAEFLAAGMLVPTMPTLDVSALARRTVATPNHRLPTLAAHLRLPCPRGGAALDEARVVAAVLPTILSRLGEALTYPVPPTPRLDVPRGDAAPAPRARAVTPDTVEPWLAGLMTRVSASASETNDPRVAAYLEALTDVVARGRIVTDEAAELARMLARSGYPASRIRAVLERLLESLRVAAFEERRITTSQLRHLRAVAASVGIPTYFDDLIPPPPPAAPRPGSGTFSRPVRKPLPAPPPPHAPRCGHCLTIGHWTANCPRLRGRSGPGAVGPVPRVDPI